MSGKTRQSLLSSQLKFYPTTSYISATLLAWREEVILIRDALGLYDILIKLKQTQDSTMMDGLARNIYNYVIKFATHGNLFRFAILSKVSEKYSLKLTSDHFSHQSPQTSRRMASFKISACKIATTVYILTISLGIIFPLCFGCSGNYQFLNVYCVNSQ